MALILGLLLFSFIVTSVCIVPFINTLYALKFQRKNKKSKDMLNKIKYKTPPAAWFYNLILEPLLGLYRTIYMDDPGKVMNFRRYQKPISDIYDQVYLF